MSCIRKFPNTNSENRHTYCITEEEAKTWADNYNIQNCLGIKRNADGYFQKIRAKTNTKLELQADDSNGLDELSLEVKLSDAIIQTINEDEINLLINQVNLNDGDEQANRDRERERGIASLLLCSHDYINYDSYKHEKDLVYSPEDLFRSLNCNYEVSLIDDLCNLNVSKEEKIIVDENLINEFNKIYFNPRENFSDKKVII